MARITQSKRQSTADGVVKVKHPTTETVRGANPAKTSQKNDSKLLFVSLGQQERIVQKYLLGVSVRKIAREEKRNRETVAKVIAIRAEDQQTYVAEVRSLFLGIAMAAVACVKTAIQDGNAEMAYRLLEDFGVVPSTRKGVSSPLADPHCPAAPPNEAAQQTLFSLLSESDKIKFRLLKSSEIRAEAYGFSKHTIQFPER